MGILALGVDERVADVAFTADSLSVAAASAWLVMQKDDRFRIRDE